jgi:hypothetical protein
MPTMLVVHGVEDVDHWLQSPERGEVSGPLGYAGRTSSTRLNPIASH